MTARTLHALGIAAVVACGLTSAAVAGDACFESTQVNEWAVAGDQTIVLQLRTQDYYRVVLANRIPQLTKFASDVVVSANNKTVCDGSDLNVYLMFSGGPGVKLGVAKIAKLSNEEIAAVGPEALPGRRFRGD